MVEAEPEHFVYCSPSELERYMEIKMCIRDSRKLSSINEFPAEAIVEIRNERTVNGISIADVLVDYYALRGAKDTYFWFGSDYLGRDLFTRLFCGSRISLLIAFLSVITNVFIGVVYGSIAGYYGCLLYTSRCV